MRAAVLVLLLLASGCLSPAPARSPPGADTPPDDGALPGDTPPPDPGRASEAPSDPATRALVEANTRFALDAFRRMSAETPGKNLIVSPYSIATALQMLYGGADGETRRAMAEALRLGEAEPVLDAAASALLGHLGSSDPNTTLRTGNALWIDEVFAPAVNASFPARIASSYRGDLYTEDFRDPETVDLVNDWASDRTEGKIPKVLESIGTDAVLLLMNAVYFKGAWTTAFNASCTHAADFTTDGDAVRRVDMMCGGKEHTYAADANRTLARLPYGDGRVAMYVVLPPEGAGLDDFVERWDGDLAAGYSPYVELEMPRFKVATASLDLKPTLADLGMGVTFTERADLTRIADHLYVSRALHDAVIEVDEQGTVAAAVTTVEASLTSLPPPPLHLVLDRPFLVAIRDDATGTLLFLGKVQDPTAG